MSMLALLQDEISNLINLLITFRTIHVACLPSCL
jgi:hypothetical protein